MKAELNEEIAELKRREWDKLCTELDRVEKEIEEEERIVSKFW